ncbi:glycerol kinase 1, partial [Listeria ivanovii FSL F6-596]
VEELSAMGVIKIAEIKSREKRKLAKLYHPDITHKNALDDFRNWEKQVKNSILKLQKVRNFK